MKILILALIIASGTVTAKEIKPRVITSFRVRLPITPM